MFLCLVQSATAPMSSQDRDTMQDNCETQGMAVIPLAIQKRKKDVGNRMTLDRKNVLVDAHRLSLPLCVLEKSTA